MVHREYEEMLLGLEPEQRGPEQWSARELEGPPDFLNGQPLSLSLTVGERAKVRDR
jgi:hypothetical protein